MLNKKKRLKKTNKPPVILIACDKFKGCMSALDACLSVQKGILEIIPEAKISMIPVADGGEGTIEAFLLNGGRKITKTVTGPMGNKVKAEYAILDNGTAIIEMAQASGLQLVPKNNPYVSTSFGTGELIQDAIRNQCQRIILGIGGSATNDAGTGMLAALGFRFLNKKGHPVTQGGIHLGKIVQIDISAVIPELLTIPISAICDVSNPLTGTKGASRVYAPQKGATPVMVHKLETNMEHFRELIQKLYKIDLNKIPGSGAGGGIAGGALIFLKATLESGIATVLHHTSFSSLATKADLVITGEGQIDEQTIQGKVISGISQITSSLGIPLLCFTGNNKLKEEIPGVSAILSIAPGPMTLEESLLNGPRQLEQTARMAAGIWLAGVKYSQQL